MRIGVVERARWIFPLRPSAVGLLLAAGLVVVVFTPKSSDFVLHPAGLVALGLVVVCVAWVVLGTLWLHRRVQRLDASVPEKLETGVEQDTGFALPSLRRWLVLEVAVTWRTPVPVTARLEPNGRTLVEVVRPTGRGRLGRLTRVFTVSDLFGLCALSFHRTWDVAAAVVPRPAKAAPELAAQRAAGDMLADPAGQPDGDYVEMRAYARGDPMRHILWKAYARTRRLLVRTPERSLSPAPMAVGFLVAGPRDEASASAARLFVESGLLGAELVFAADGAEAPARTPAEAVQQIVDSAAHRERGGEGLHSLAAQIEPGRLTSVVVFAPAADGPWRDRLTGFLAGLGRPATVIIGVEHDPDPAPASVVERFLLEPEPDRLGPRGLPALRSALESAGLTVQLLHRETGQTL